MTMCEYEVIIPTIADNADLLALCLDRLKRYAQNGLQRITLVGPASVQRHASDLGVSYLDESSLENCPSLAEIKEYLLGRGADPARAGWYLQQFIKLDIANRDQTLEHYVVWDSDTVPLREIKFFDDDKILYAASSEYHRPYFDTMKRIADLDRISRHSFIAEYMVFKKSFVIELLDVISAHTSSRSNIYMGILDAVDAEDLSRSGFSEFETYGNHVLKAHNGSYVRKKHRKLRNACDYIRFPLSSDDALDYFARDHDVASFEAAWPFDPYRRAASVRCVEHLRNVLPPRIAVRIAEKISSLKKHIR